MPNILVGTGRTLLYGRAVAAAYLLRDEFTTNAAAPLGSPRTCEPGPGTLTLVEVDGQFSISGNKLQIPAQATPVWGDLGFYSGASFARTAGRALRATVRRTNTTGFGPILGSGTTGSAHYSTLDGLGWYFHQTSATIRAVNAAGMAWELGTWEAATDYQIAVVQRGAGEFLLVKGGAYTTWTPLWVGNAGTNATLVPQLANYDGSGTLDDLTLSDFGGSWATDYGIATSRTAGAVPTATAFTHTADCIIEWAQTTLPSAGLVTDVVFRRQDDNNLWLLEIVSSGGMQLYERVAGAFTSRGSSTGVIAGSRCVITADGSTIRFYSDNVLKFTYASATNFKTETNGAFNPAYLSSAGGAISDLISWPRDVSAFMPAGV